MPIDFRTEPARWRHWRLEVAGRVATLSMDVDPSGGIFPDCELKLNSYDLGVDIELADAVQRLRFEHPEVGAVVLRSAKPGIFCAGANIRMLGRASHAHKVNFCKFTNETRLAIEEAAEFSRQPWLAAVAAPAAGGGYELALACAHIMLVDDRRATVALPEVPLLGVLPATGGLTRLTDKRRVRRDRADAFCTTEEGVRGRRALDWALVDELVPPSKWEDAVAARAAATASGAPRKRVASRVNPLPIGYAPKLPAPRRSVAGALPSAPACIRQRSAAKASSASVPAKQLPGSINATRLREETSSRFSTRRQNSRISRASQSSPAIAASAPATSAGSPSVRSTQSPSSGSLTRRCRIASSSARAAASGQNAAPS